MRQWLYPIAEIVHITGIALLVGSIAMFDLRLLGLSRALPVRRLARHLLPWTLTGFAVVATSGAMMFTAHATEFWTNPAFAVKLTLIAVAGADALCFTSAPAATSAAGTSTARRLPVRGRRRCRR